MSENDKVMHSLNDKSLETAKDSGQVESVCRCSEAYADGVGGTERMQLINQPLAECDENSLETPSTRESFTNPIKLTFTNSAQRFIYSNNPEGINGKYFNDFNTRGGLWLGYGNSLSSDGAYVTHEMYHHNWSGRILKFGWVIYNDNSSSVEITYRGVIRAQPGGDNPNFCATVLLDYLKIAPSQYKKMSIPAKGYAWIASVNTNHLDLAYGRMQASSPKSNVYIRPVCGLTTTSPGTYFTIQQLAPLPSDLDYNEQCFRGQFSGEVNYWGKNTTVDRVSGRYFRLGEWLSKDNYGVPCSMNSTESSSQDNINEYDTVVFYKVGGKVKPAANFGTSYNITINNPAGKQIEILPNLGNNFPDGKPRDICKVARILLYTDATGWYATSRLTSGGTVKSWFMNTSTASRFTFRLMIPGGNCGNIIVRFTDRNNQ